MEDSKLIKKITDEAKKNKKKIVLPESSDTRVLQAACEVAKNDIADITLIGNEKDIKDAMEKNNIMIPESNFNIIDPINSYKTNIYANALYELRKHKGLTIEQASKLVLDNVYFGTMMVKLGDADGMVSGAIHSSSDTLRPALQIIKQREDVGSVSSFFLMETKKQDLGSDGVFIFSDCGLIEFPTEDQLLDIVKSSVLSFKTLVKDTPRVALLSYSTKGSANSDQVQKTRNVYAKLKEQNVDFVFDGELQLDAAIIPEVAELKAPDSVVAGRANILIFPNLEAGNIGYKLVQRFGDAIALGPVTQGLKKPINDLSRGCTAKDIIGTIAITCIQANNNG